MTIVTGCASCSDHSICRADCATVSCHTPAPDSLVDGGITLSVNPEARVYASRHRPGVLEARRGAVVSVPVGISNSGFVSAPMRAVLISPADGSVEVRWSATPLDGRPTEHRTLELLVHTEGFTEVTLSFCLPFDSPDLGGRDRVRLVIRTASPTTLSLPSMPAHDLAS
ncbi:hypothetical protein ACTU6U_02985 [Microbacterium sp. A196]|uniref:hypothetical protein n=1 Tax=Microbacterium sp. A196 TaxID=3457320 RepID=UPI003FD48D0C